MNTPLLFCCDARRLDVIRRLGSANAIEWLEVRDRLEPDTSLRQRTLFVRLLRAGAALSAANVAIEGGARVPAVPVEWAAMADALPAGVDPSLVAGIDEPARTLVVRTTMPGDFSAYRLALRAGAGSDQAPAGFDPPLSAIAFSFKVECPADQDCDAATVCPPQPVEGPRIDTLAKDYPGFRRLLLDRLALLAPGWQERSAADVGVTLVELLAYAADNLSYRQDAIATEAYLSTARRRVSVRRHARLVDYALHEGCNARAWVCLRVTAEHLLPARTMLLTRAAAARPPQDAAWNDDSASDATARFAPDGPALVDALAGGATVFETARDQRLLPGLHRLLFHAWGDAACCLPRGATRATLRDAQPLAAGDVLVFEEVLSPTRLTAADADRGKRWAVRLTRVRPGTDPSGRLFDEPPVDEALPVTEIEWHVEDALPFALCLSVPERPGLPISVARGNVVLADHGRSVVGEPLGTVPPSRLDWAPTAAAGCERPAIEPIPPRFRPRIEQAPVTRGFDLARDLDRGAAAEPDDAWRSARALVARDPHEALPRVARLQGREGTLLTDWRMARDLLASAGTDRHAVLEPEDDGGARLRFGDGIHGERPDAGTRFEIDYRVGSGVVGNVGADAIVHVVSAHDVFAWVRNPLPAAGGIDPEDVEAARRDAPQAFRTQERAVTPDDYAAAAQRLRGVQRAAATMRWTGSWHTVFVTADREGGAPVDARFERRLRAHLERFRMAGYDLEVDAPRDVALDVELHVCALPGHFRAHVLRAVAQVLSNGTLPDGRTGLFHPDRFSFGQPVHLSPIVAAAHGVEGVEAVWVKRFQRMVSPDPASLRSGVIPIGRLEIARLDNDPNFRERGRLVLTAGGGK